MNIKKALLFMCLCASFIFAGCGTKFQDEETINNDIVDVLDTVLQVGEVLRSYEIVERESDEEALIDKILYEIIVSDGISEYTKYYELVYEVDEDKDWGVEGVEPKRQEQWSSVPLKGVEKVDITDFLIDNTFMIDGESWYIDSTSIGDIKELTRTTELEKKRDSIILSVELLSTVLAAYGELQADYVYDNGWYLQDVKMYKEFETSYQEGKELFITDELVVDALSKNPISFGKRAQGSSQTITVLKEGVTDLVIGDKRIDCAGTLQMCDFSFLLNTAVANLKVAGNASFEYDFARGWIIKEVQYSDCSVKELKLEKLKGKWIGQMSEFDTLSYPMQSVKLDITEVNNQEGVLSATISVPSEKRSCELIGYVNFIDLSFELNFEKWIQKPSEWASIYKPALCGVIEVDTGTFNCIDTTEYNTFELQKAE